MQVSELLLWNLSFFDKSHLVSKLPIFSKIRWLEGRGSGACLKSWTAKTGQTLDREQRTHPRGSLNSSRAFFYPILRMVSQVQTLVNLFCKRKLTLGYLNSIWWNHSGVKFALCAPFCFMGPSCGSCVSKALCCNPSEAGDSNSCPCTPLTCLPLEFWLEVFLTLYMVLLLFVKQSLTFIPNWAASAGGEMLPIMCEVLRKERSYMQWW